MLRGSQRGARIVEMHVEVQRSSGCGTKFGAIHGGLFVAFIAILLIGMNKHWNRVALFHGFVAAVVPAGPFLFDGMLISGEYDIDSSSLDTLGP